MRQIWFNVVMPSALHFKSGKNGKNYAQGTGERENKKDEKITLNCYFFPCFLSNKKKWKTFFLKTFTCLFIFGNEILSVSWLQSKLSTIESFFSVFSSLVYCLAFINSVFGLYAGDTRNENEFYSIRNGRMKVHRLFSDFCLLNFRSLNAYGGCPSPSG